MLKKIFISVVLIIAVLSFVVSLLGGKNNISATKKLAGGQDTIAVIDVNGTMISGGGPATTVFSRAEGASSGIIMKELREAAEDKNVKAVLLNINSPGGSVTAAEEIAREIDRFKSTSKKPIVATMGDSGASAAYYIAADCDKIYANASTLTGSIGVYMAGMNLEEIYKKIGVSPFMIKSGEHKDIMSPNRPMTDQEKVIIQTMVNEMFEQFLNRVSTGRKKPLEEIRTLADGRVYTGKQALELGLVDEIGNFYDAVDGTAALAGIKGKPKIKEYGIARDWASLFMDAFTKSITAKLQESLPQLQTTNWNKG
jgi:protease-4